MLARDHSPGWNINKHTCNIGMLKRNTNIQFEMHLAAGLQISSWLGVGGGYSCWILEHIYRKWTRCEIRVFEVISLQLHQNSRIIHAVIAWCPPQCADSSYVSMQVFTIACRDMLENVTAELLLDCWSLALTRRRASRSWVSWMFPVQSFSPSCRGGSRWLLWGERDIPISAYDS